jgi:cation diffusion facilitator CzcD-associated flavoprotein CzcO
MEVCIIGGGFSGIASCKQALKHGLVPLVLEKKSNIGGLWQGEPNSVGVWNDLDANSSKQMMWFSDHPWPSDDPEYPSRSQVCSYLLSYVSKHNLNQYISLNSNVEEVTQVEEAYSVTWTSGSITHKKTFKYIIIASGKYSKNCSPLPNSQNFKGNLSLLEISENLRFFKEKKLFVLENRFQLRISLLKLLKMRKVLFRSLEGRVF